MAFEHGLTPIICCGETLTQRVQGITLDWIRKQVKIAFQNVTADQAKTAVIAYEPIWAIGTGVSASTEEITETHRYLKAVLSELTGSDIPLLYGGSVNEKNAADIGSCPGVDGFLIGGASLKPEKFRKIIEVSKRE